MVNTATKVKMDWTVKHKPKPNLLVRPGNEPHNPLQAILSNTEAALLLLSNSNPEIDKVKAALEAVISEVGRLNLMIVGTPR